ncbi:unnamed protein product, partial [Mesorhabditis spiculigera]
MHTLIMSSSCPSLPLIGFNSMVLYAVRRSRRMHVSQHIYENLEILARSPRLTQQFFGDHQRLREHLHLHAVLGKYRLLLRHYLCCDWSRQGEMLLNSVMA